MYFITARDALLLLGADVVRLRNLIDKGYISFYLERDSFFTGQHKHFFPRRYVNFISEIDNYYFDYQEFNGVIYKNNAHLYVKCIVYNKQTRKACEQCDTEGTEINYKLRIAELETELAACREQLKEARGANPSGVEGHGLCSLVIRMRGEGRTEEEIAAHLHDNKQWCSAAQVGALLHRGGRVTADSMLKYGQRLLGKA